MEVSTQGGIPDGIDGLWLLMGVTAHNRRGDKITALREKKSEFTKNKAAFKYP